MTLAVKLSPDQYSILQAIALPALAVLCFTFALLVIDNMILKTQMKWFHDFVTSRALRAIILCGIFSALGSMMISSALFLNPFWGSVSLIACTAFSHGYVAITFFEKQANWDVKVAGLVFVLAGVVFAMAVEKSGNRTKTGANVIPPIVQTT